MDDSGRTTNTWEGNNISGSARVHQGHVFNQYQHPSDAQALMSLLSSNYERGKDRNPKRTPGTCQWVVSHEKFVRWRDHPSAAALWVSAELGAGKSVLSRALVDETLICSDSTVEPPPAICYFFFKADDSTQDTAEAALCALLYQLLLARDWAMDHATEIHKKKKDALSGSLPALWSLLEKVVADPRTGSVCFVLDALDECDEISRNDLIERIASFVTGEIGRPSKAKFFLTSRPYPEIENTFRSSMENVDQINLRPEDDSYRTLKSEINLAIEQQVRRLFKGYRYPPSDAVQRHVIDALRDKDNLTYLWVSLVLNDLGRTRISQEERLVQFINRFPRNLDAAYVKLLDRVLPQEQEEARTLFHIILVANKPLTLDEMDIALVPANGQQAADTGRDGHCARACKRPTRRWRITRKFEIHIRGKSYIVLQFRAALVPETFTKADSVGYRSTLRHPSTSWGYDTSRRNNEPKVPHPSHGAHD
ncbi:hypothetical protein QBC37DRAFT_282321 [Rhypophila decipiens]|uniref:Nephrocystin 3-like N-terminal domain-containing protein n=1 Tax=Rhypophila decipiens TaxID=261697 RepID=A0AAN6YC41_9PEZI|nr:hypothetical protein QBC37DRAFT_282321 [Rhypophila decipiens]